MIAHVSGTDSRKIKAEDVVAPREGRPVSADIGAGEILLEILSSRADNQRKTCAAIFQFLDVAGLVDIRKTA